MQPTKATRSETDAEPMQVAPVSVWWYGVICFFGLLVTLVVLVLFNVITGIKPPTGSDVVGLLLSIHFANWRFIRKYGRVLVPVELKWFALSCGAAFCVYDEPVGLAARILSGTEGPIEKAATTVVALLYAFAIAGAIVYGTVPWISKRITSASA